MTCPTSSSSQPGECRPSLIDQASESGARRPSLRRDRSRRVAVVVEHVACRRVARARCSSRALFGEILVEQIEQRRATHTVLALRLKNRVFACPTSMMSRNAAYAKQLDDSFGSASPWPRSGRSRCPRRAA